jgi:dolichol-phosphate mannosyltransferase
MRLSIVIPIYNEKDVISELYNRLRSVRDSLPADCEMIFVDDGSSDSSFASLEHLHQKDPRIKCIQFSRNFGHHIAVTAGLDAAYGDIVIVMDGDLQNRPEDIPALVKKIEEGYDVVYTIRKNRQDSLFKRLCSRAFVWLMRQVVREPLAADSSIFRAMRQSVVAALRETRERNRYVVGLIGWVGFRHTWVEVLHDKRFAGKSTYSFRRQVRLALDALFSFSTLPLQLASMVGFGITCFSFLYGALLIIRKLVWGFVLPGYASIMVAIFFLGGVQLIMLGIIGSYIGRIYREVQQRPLYVIQRRLGIEK